MVRSNLVISLVPCIELTRLKCKWNKKGKGTDETPLGPLLFYLVSVAYVQGHESVQDTFVKSSIVIHFWRWTIILRNLRKMWSSAVTAVVVAGLEVDTKYWCALQWWKISWNHTETTKDESSSHVWTPASPGLNLLWHKADCDHYGSECGARSSAQWSSV